MAIIDSDAHVLETPESWRFMEGEDKKFVPGMFRTKGLRENTWDEFLVLAFHETP